MNTSDQKLLNKLRTEYLQKIIIRLEDKPAVFIEADIDFRKYTYLDEDKTSVSIPESSGVYVFYSKKTHIPVYVGESNNLKKRLNHHCRISGTSVFKRRWVTTWLGVPSSTKEVVNFIHSRMYFKIITLPFGRKEIETDLQSLWKLSNPQLVDKDIF